MKRIEFIVMKEERKNYRKIMSLLQQKKATKYHKYDFRQRNFPWYGEKTNREEALNKGILRCKFMHIYNEKNISYSFSPAKENLFIQFLCFFYALSWDHFIFSMMLEKPFVAAAISHECSSSETFSTQFSSFSSRKNGSSRKIDF